MKRLLWLDDMEIRNPNKPEWLRLSPIGTNVDVYWVKSYNEFVDWIYINGLPDGISFDHDLADEHYFYSIGMDITYSKFKEKTGYDAAKWLVNYCIDNNAELPICGVHSFNNVGAENIKMLLKNFNKFKHAH